MGEGRQRVGHNQDSHGAECRLNGYTPARKGQYRESKNKMTLFASCSARARHTACQEEVQTKARACESVTTPGERIGLRAVEAELRSSRVPFRTQC